VLSKTRAEEKSLKRGAKTTDTALKTARTNHDRGEHGKQTKCEKGWSNTGGSKLVAPNILTPGEGVGKQCQNFWSTPSGRIKNHEGGNKDGQWEDGSRAWLQVNNPGGRQGGDNAEQSG